MLTVSSAGIGRDIGSKSNAPLKMHSSSAATAATNVTAAATAQPRSPASEKTPLRMITSKAPFQTGRGCDIMSQCLRTSLYSHMGDIMKKALVTGSSRGIGAAIARALAEDGWHVTINYLTSKDKAEALAAELGSEAVQCDVADSRQVREMFERVGGVDLLVSNAGIAWSGLLTDMTDEEWNRIFAVNVGGAFNCCRAAIPHMVHEKAGSIVCVSSILGVYGGSCETAYSATKGAIISFVKGLAKELGPSGIRVNGVAPGAIDTDMLSCFTAEDKAHMAENTYLGRLGRAVDVARAVRFLASDDAGFVTGQILGVDGAMVI